MIVFLNLDGTARIVSPERVFQGSSVNIVSAIYAGASNTSLQIAFTLPNRVVTQYAPMSYNVASQEELAGVWEYKIPTTVTEKTGTVGMTICATLPNGKQTSYNLTFNVEYAALPQLPPTPDQNVYDLILQYLAENQSQIVAATNDLEKLDEEVYVLGGSVENLKVRVENLEDLPTDGHGLGMFKSVAQLKSMYPTAQENDYAAIAGGNIWIYQNGEWTDTGKEAVFSPADNSVVQTFVVQNLGEKQQQQARDNILAVGPAKIKSKETYSASLRAANSIIDFVSYAPDFNIVSQTENETNYIKLCELFSITQTAAPVVNIKIEGVDTNGNVVNADIHISTSYDANATPKFKLVEALQRTEGKSPINVWVDCYSVVGNKNFIAVYTECFRNQKMCATISAVGVVNRFESQEPGGRGYARAQFVSDIPSFAVPTTLLPSLDELGQIGQDNQTELVKNLYNLEAYDTYTAGESNTGVGSRKTGIKMYRGADVTKVITTYTNVVYYAIPKPTDYFYYNQFDDRKFMANKFKEGHAEGVGWDSVNQIGTISGLATVLNFWIGFPIGTTLSQAQQAIDGLILQYEVAEQYQYSEPVIDKQPLRFLNQAGEYELYKEWEKGLNLWKSSIFSTTKRSLSLLKLKVGSVYTISPPTGYSIKVAVNWDSSGANILSTVTGGEVAGNSPKTFIYNDDKEWKVFIDPGVNQGGEDLSTFEIMLVEGSHPYPYEPYYGKIVREKDLSGIQLFPTTVNPPETIGGDWENLGAITTTDRMLAVWRKL